jgi:glycosyltransferase involved in cell wall biosynthesis
MHLCVHDKELEPYKTPLQRHYHAWWIRHVEQYVISRAAQIIAVSEYTARKTEKAFRCAKPLVIHNAVDTVRTFRAGAPRAPHTPFRLLYAGNWSARKGTDLLSPIMAELGSEFELRYTADRADAHRRNSLPPNCQCISRATSAEKMAALYQDADALLFPSRMEGLPLAVIEAMACGLPVIAARASSLPEAVEDRITGLLCSPNDVQAFIDAARTLASSEHQWRAMREAGRARAESEFDMDAMVNAYIEVYRRALT